MMADTRTEADTIRTTRESVKARETPALELRRKAGSILLGTN
jgi:hypothetical protein